MQQVSAGFITNYLADLAFPPWYYIVIRGLVPGHRIPSMVRWFGASRERAAALIFLVGAVMEVYSYFRPIGVFGGRFDVMDLAAYAVGLAIAYTCDKARSVTR